LNYAGKFDANLSVDGHGSHPHEHVHVETITKHAAHVPAGAIIVPDAQLLFNGDFKRTGVDLVLTNWRSVFGAPGINDAQKKALGEVVDKMVKSNTWKEILKQKGWDEAYLAGDDFAKFLANEQTRVNGVMKTVGLVK